MGMIDLSQWVELEQVADFSSGGTPSKANSAYWNGNIPWVSAKDMKSPRLQDTEDHISEMGLASGSRLAPAGSTLVLVRGMTLLNDVPMCIASRDVAFNQDIKALTPKCNVVGSYLNYALRAAKPQLLAAVDLAGHGTGKIPTDILKSIRIWLPDAKEQLRIARVLEAIDDKIELNRRMNDTLEAMARAIFQSWFIDFDPVRAKAGGESPDSICQRLGMTTELLARFPETFVESPLSAIPAGWTVCALDEIAEYLNGLALQKFPAVEGDDWLPVVKIAQLRAGHTHTADKASTQVPPAYVVENGDVLFSWSGSLEVDIWCGGRGALNQHLFKVTSNTYPRWFYFLWTKYHLNAFRDIAANKATTMGHIQRKHLTEATVLCPPLAVIDEMTKVMAPLIDMTISCRLESARLAQVRDALLPELLSGNIDLGNERESS